MYEEMTFERILEHMLKIVPDNVDKRDDNSLIYNACAAAAMVIAQFYIKLDTNYRLSFADTATGEELTRRCAEFGVNRYPATKARREGLFFDGEGNPCNIPLGSRFSIDNLNYVTINQLGRGRFSMECEVTGVIGNEKFGTMLPIDYIDGLSVAELAGVLVPGQNKEGDEELRKRYYEFVNEPAFGGNVSDYKQKINAIDGVGGTKVFPVWKGGGTVKCTIISSTYDEPSKELVDEVQTIVDPMVNRGKGLGTAPIGHEVTIKAAQGFLIDVETNVVLSASTIPGQIQDEIESVVRKYFLELRKEWANQEQMIIRVAQIDARILTVEGIEDVMNTKLNGSSLNITLGDDEIPELGTVLVDA